MGSISHHAIVVTGSTDNGNWVAKARRKAGAIFPRVSAVTREQNEGFESFFIPPDGSKEGWEDSNIGDERREEFKTWLDSTRYEDNSSPLQWVEVQFHDNDGNNIIVRHSDDVPLKG